MADFTMSRSTVVQSEPSRIHPLIDDFREWPRWSPWEGLDDNLHREYSGPDRGVGSTYRWSGNRKAGEGEMAITESTPSSVVVDLVFLKPFRASNVIRFDLTPSGTGTEVVWSMTGRRGALMNLMGRAYFDKAVGRDFEKGLASLKREAEKG